ncbi:MAG: hypothetical protein ACOYMZ_03145 [Minisyncoccia bacterium]
MKYSAIPITALLLLAFGTPALAQESNTDASVTVEQKETATTINTEGATETKRPALPAVPRIFKTSVDQLKAKREEAKDAIEARKADRVMNREEKREEIKTTIEARRAEIMAKREEVKVKIEERKAEMKAKLLEVKKERLSVRKEYVYGRLVSAVAIIESRQARVSALLDKMEARGKEVASAQASLATSIEAFASAKASIASLKGAEANAETEAGALKAVAQKAEASLKEARLALIKALDSIAPEVAVSTSVETTVE